MHFHKKKRLLLLRNMLYCGHRLPNSFILLPFTPFELLFWGENTSSFNSRGFNASSQKNTSKGLLGQLSCKFSWLDLYWTRMLWATLHHIGEHNLYSLPNSPTLNDRSFFCMKIETIHISNAKDRGKQKIKKKWKNLKNYVKNSDSQQGTGPIEMIRAVPLNRECHETHDHYNMHRFGGGGSINSNQRAR